MAIEENVGRELIKNLIQVIILLYIIRFLWRILYINNIMPELVKRRKKK